MPAQRRVRGAARPPCPTGGGRVEQGNADALACPDCGAVVLISCLSACNADGEGVITARESLHNRPRCSPFAVAL